ELRASVRGDGGLRGGRGRTSRAERLGGVDDVQLFERDDLEPPDHPEFLLCSGFAMIWTAWIHPVNGRSASDGAWMPAKQPATSTTRPTPAPAQEVERLPRYARGTPAPLVGAPRRTPRSRTTRDRFPQWVDRRGAYRPTRSGRSPSRTRPGCHRGHVRR